ncbi:MAG: hypothetical protein HZB24_11625 [Desulfobacterales bacterium]|nr:hypothetical protein [Desulfobacterales bacterium]
MGEYKTFTRIVFELDKAPPTIPDISGNPDELRVIFQDIAVDLVRKIPIKQSPHVKGVQIWLKANQLSAVFKVDTPFAHSKISSMSNPPRLLVDINWQTSAQRPDASETASPPPAKTDSSTTDTSAFIAAPVEKATPLLPQKSLELPASPQPSVSPANEAPAETVVSSELPANSTSESEKLPPEVSVLTPPQEILGLPTGTDAGTSFPIPSHRPNRLQYYLVIGLVVLTIAILLMLVVMLLTKYRWTNDRLLLNMDDHLNEQQAKIETINGRIKEQLKHYEKA